MTEVEQLAAFVERASFEGLSKEAREQLKIRIFDALGCAIGALEGQPVQMVRALTSELGGTERCSIIGGGSSAPDRAALVNGFLVRYLDFNDSYLAKGETCHPSDSLGAILAACEYAGGSGRDLLAALAVSYQVQCRLSDEAPVRARGFDHTVQGAYAVAAGSARALGLDRRAAANAIAISGTAFNALRGPVLFPTGRGLPLPTWPLERCLPPFLPCAASRDRVKSSRATRDSKAPLPGRSASTGAGRRWRRSRGPS